VRAEVKEQEHDDSPKDKFFIVKSLTVESLELSVRSGIWVTQPHNEVAFNKAYQVCRLRIKVFLMRKALTSNIGC
jgi:hypothetical protein